MSILVQKTQSEAEAERDAQNALYTTAGIDATVQAVAGQVNNWFASTIPTGRVAEFEAGDATKQNNFAQFTATAYSQQYAGTDFVTAWEAEYAKVYP